MNVLTQNSFWYAAAGLVSALLAVILTHVTLESKRKPVFGWLCWGAALVCYFLFAWIGCTVTTPQWWDYFIFFGWMIFLPPPCFFLYKEPASTKLFTVVTVIFISNVGSFLTGISTTALISTIDPYGEEGYLFLIPFTLMKALIAAIIGVVMVVFVRRTMIEVFNILSHKMGRYVPIPFIASFGFFCIVQIVQAVGLLPQTGMLFVLFYLIICLIFGVMYWLIFSNALWSSRAMKTQAELNVARNIQHDMLPCIFPAFPERNEFDIYATMDPAKEVGGDFYDFFLVDDRLCSGRPGKHGLQGGLHSAWRGRSHFPLHGRRNGGYQLFHRALRRRPSGGRPEPGRQSLSRTASGCRQNVDGRLYGRCGAVRRYHDARS